MFDYNYVLQKLKNFDGMRESKQLKFLNNLFHDKDFVEYLFNPKKTENTESEIIALYQELTKPKVIRAIVDMIEDVGYNEFDRSIATFINSICNQAIAYNNEFIESASNEKRAGNINSKKFDEMNEKAEKYNRYVADLLKCSRKIVKKEAKDLASQTNIPKYVCILALKSVPEPEYVKTFKVSYYLANLLNNIYAEVDHIGDFSDNVNWRPFFKTVFGKNNTIEVATFILLEGVHRIDKYKNSKDVHACWDTLTSFALRELNDAPDQLRTQMIELYIKKIAKMFANRSYDLRVDLLNIDDGLFPKLAKSVVGYADKITGILSNKNNRPE